MNVFALISVIPFLFIGVKTLFAPYIYSTGTLSGVIAWTTVSGIFGLLYIVFVLVLPFAITIAIDQTTRGETPDVNAVYKKAFSSVIPYLAIVLLSIIIVIGGSVLFIIPGIIAGIYITLAIYAFIFEGAHGIDAFILSAWYVKGFWWDILARKITLAILIGIVSIIFAGIVGTIIFAFGFGLPVFQFLFRLFLFMTILPFSFIFTYLIYTDARSIKIASTGSAVPDKAFVVEAERIYILLISIAALVALGLFLVISFGPHTAFSIHI
jgi:hypothetical protein